MKNVVMPLAAIFSVIFIVSLSMLFWNTRDVVSCEPQCVTCEPESCRKTFEQKHFCGSC